MRTIVNRGIWNSTPEELKLNMCVHREDEETGVRPLGASQLNSVSWGFILDLDVEIKLAEHATKRERFVPRTHSFLATFFFFFSRKLWAVALSLLLSSPQTTPYHTQLRFCCPLQRLRCIPETEEIQVCVTPPYIQCPMCKRKFFFFRKTGRLSRTFRCC